MIQKFPDRNRIYSIMAHHVLPELGFSLLFGQHPHYTPQHGLQVLLVRKFDPGKLKLGLGQACSMEPETEK